MKWIKDIMPLLTMVATILGILIAVYQLQQYRNMQQEWKEKNA